MDGIADYMQPCQLDDNGDSPFGLSCEQFSLRNVKQLLSLMEIRKIWITGKDLIKLASAHRKTHGTRLTPATDARFWQ